MTTDCLTQCLTGWLTINLPTSCTEGLKVAPADWITEVLAGYLPSASKANFTDSWPELETKRQLSLRLETPSPSWSSSQASPAKTIESFKFQDENDYKVRDFVMEQLWARANQRHLGGKHVIPSSFQYKVLRKCCRVKTSQEHCSSFGIFRSAKRLSYQQ